MPDPIKQGAAAAPLLALLLLLRQALPKGRLREEYLPAAAWGIVVIGLAIVLAPYGVLPESIFGPAVSPKHRHDAGRVPMPWRPAETRE